MVRQDEPPRWLTIGRRVAWWLAGIVSGLYALAATINIVGGGFADAPDTKDFMCFYAAGHAVAQIGAARLYDWANLLPVVQSITGQQTPYFVPWFYPPSFLLLLEPLSHLSLQAAHLVWSLGTLGLLMGTIFVLAGRLAVVGALTSVLVWAELQFGQNGFLTATLLGAALWLAPRRPLVAGVLAGLLTYKPQFALMLPVLLVATQNWRAIAAAATTASAMVAASAWRYGAASWFAFFQSRGQSAHVLLSGQVLHWGILQSPYGLLRWLGAGYSVAAAMHGLVVVGAILGIVCLCIRPYSHEVRCALTAIATALATPYVLVWDLTILGVAAAFLTRLARRAGTPAWHLAALVAIVWAPWAAGEVPVGVPCAAVLLAMLWTHVLRERHLVLAAQAATGCGRIPPCIRSAGLAAYQAASIRPD